MSHSHLRKLPAIAGSMRLLCACAAMLASPAMAQLPTPLPELIYYNFDGANTTVDNLAAPATRVNASGTLLGDVKQGGLQDYPSGMVGSGNSARTDHLDTGWVTNLSGSWTISFCLHHIPSNDGQTYYLFGDKTAGQFRCIANGTSGPNTVTLRATNIVDVVVEGAMVPGEATVTHLVYDSVAGEIRAYVNGVLKTTVAQVFSPITVGGTGTLKIGGYSSDLVDQALVGLPENGLLDEFRLYNRALSLAEIESSWQFGVIPTKPDYEITTDGGQISVVDISGNDDTLTLSAPAAGQILFAAAGRKFRVDGGALRDHDSGAISLGSTDQINVSGELGHDLIQIGAFTGLPSLVVSGGGGDDTVTFTGPITFAADASLNVDQRSDADRCVISAALQLTGTGSATILTNKDILLEPTGSISVADGDLTLEAHQQAIASTDNFTALDLHGALSSTGTGNIHLRGRGAAGALAAPGVLLEDATVTSSGTGTVSLTGTMSGDSDVTSTGIVLRRSSITSKGNITLDGTGGDAPAIAVGDAGSSGVLLESSGSVTAEDNANVVILGTGGETTGLSQGVILLGNIEADSGELQVTGVAQDGAEDVLINGPATITGPTQKFIGAKVEIGDASLTASSLLQITADQLSIAALATLSGTTTEILNKSAARPIELGSADGPGVLGLTDAELDRISSTTLKIGSANAGSVKLLASLSRPGAVELRSGGTIDLQTGSITAGALLLDPTSTILHKNAGVDAELSSGGPGALTFGSAEKLQFTIVSSVVHDALAVNGIVDLTGAGLQLYGTYEPTEYSEHFIIIENDGSDAVTGTFTGLAEGSYLPFNGRDLRITYRGGDGNDVVLYTKPDYLVTSTVGGGPLVLTNPSGSDDALMFSQLPGGEISFAAAGRRFSVDDGPVRDGSSGAVSIATGVTSVVVDAGAGNDVITIGGATDMAAMTINGGRGDDAVSFTGAITFKPDADLDVDLTNDDATPGVDRCTIGAQLTLSGTGQAVFKVTRNILVTTGAGVSVVDGNLALNAHFTGDALAENFTAIELRGTLSSIGAGDIHVHGRGAAGAAEVVGVWLQDGAVTGSGAGMVVIEGGMAAASSTRSIGLYLVNSEVTAAGELWVTGTAGAGVALIPGDMASVGVLMEQSSLIEGTSGERMSITGTGAAVTATGSSFGTLITGSTVSNNGCHMTLHGTGGQASTGASRGLVVTGASEVFCLGSTTSFLSGSAASAALAPVGVAGSLGCHISADSTLEGNTAGATIGLNGTSAATDTSSWGLVIEGTLTGNGAEFSLDGASVNSTAGSAQNHGLFIAGTVDATGSTIALTGATASTADSSFGIAAAASSSLTSATLTSKSNSLDIDATASWTGTTCTIQPKTDAFSVGLGAMDADSLLGLTAAELTRLTYSTVIIGGAATGHIDQTDAINITGALELHSGTVITLGQITATGNVLLDATGHVTPSSSGSSITTPRLGFAANNTLRINIANDGAYQGISVNGEVDVTNVALNLAGTYVPPPGYTIFPVTNDDSEAIIGEFAGVPEDGEYPFNGEEFIITYLGGDGNDLEMFTYGDPTVTFGPIVLNQDNGLYEQVLTLTNPQPKAMQGVRVTVLNIQQNIVLWNRTHRFLPILESDLIVPARGTAQITMKFYNGGRNLGTWVPQYLVESRNRDLGPLPGDFGGLYHGLAFRTAGVNEVTGSSLTLSLTANGTYTGSLNTEGKVLRLKGKVGLDPLNPLTPAFTVSFPSVLRQLTVRFQPLHHLLSGELTTQGAVVPLTAQVVGWRQIWRVRAPANPAPGYKGRHNIALTHSDANADLPQGAAFSSLTVAKEDGVFAMAGRLPDGSAITGSSFIGPEGQARVFTSLYKKKGSVLGALKVTLLRPTIPNPSIIPNPITGQVDWWRPLALTTSKDRFYRNSVSLKLDAEGGLYTPPAAGQLLAAVPASTSGTPNAVMEFVDGGLDIHDGFAQLLRLYNPSTTGVTNKVQLTVQTPYAVSLGSFNSKTGLFSGKFTVPGATGVPSRRGTYSGMLVPRVGYLLGTGYFLLPRIPVPPETTAKSPLMSGKVHFWDNRVPVTP